MPQRKRGLPEIVEKQRREDHEPPRPHDRQPAEVAQIRVERLGAGHREHDRADDRPRRPAARDEQHRAVSRVECREHRRHAHHFDRAHRAQHEEPEQHHRPEDAAEAAGPEPLHEEEPREDRDRDRHRQSRPRRIERAEPFDCAEHGDRGRDRAVAEEQRRPEDEHQREQPSVLRRPGLAAEEQSHQGEDPAFAVVVRPHHEQDVLDAHDHEERPADERGDADRRVGSRDREGGLEGVERARADVAEDDPEGEQRQSRGAGGLGRVASGRHPKRRTASAARCKWSQAIEHRSRRVASSPRISARGENDAVTSMARPRSRHRIVAVAAPWMAAGDASHREPAAADGAVPLDRFESVVRAARRESALSAEDVADRLLVAADRDDQEPRGGGTSSRDSCGAGGGVGSSRGSFGSWRRHRRSSSSAARRRNRR